tara:strand:+ start:4291 stop:4563 length:273 start_codon:yes stop_codon:yes gene_type:complete
MIHYALINGLVITSVVALLVLGLLALLEKLNVLEWMQGNGNKFFSKMFSCYFCLSHHIALIIVIPSLCINQNWIELFVPLSVAGIINLIK